MNLKYFLEQIVSGNLFREWLATRPVKWQHLPLYLRLYAAILIAAGLLFQLSYPITLSDSDMWYHLDGGRYFWQQGAIPNHSFFSFIEPERVFVNYYWGFQALLAKTHEYWGYQGLLVLRALIFALTTLLAYRFIIEHRNLKFPVFLFLLLFIAYFTFIEGRTANLRPHLFSHLFILLFIYILERRPRWAPALPLVTAAWANLHGIEYPVPILIGGAYFIEILYQKLTGNQRYGDRGWKEALWLLACAPALLATPHGLELLEAPFSVSKFVSMYISEMRPLDPRALYTVALTGDNLTIENVFPIAFLICTFALLRNLLDGSLRISHAIMALGGYLLLSRGTRFVWEWALLVLPLLTQFVGNMKEVHGERKFLSMLHLLLAVVMVLPFVSMAKRLPDHADYPFNRESAPIGETRFLQHVGGSGKLLAPPSTAGFLQWELFPDYRIYADLQMSLFNDLDIYSLFSFYRNENGLAHTVEKYQPEYLSVSLGNKDFEKLLGSKKEYVPVFAGDNQVIYVNKHLRPAVAERYQLKLVDPFSLLEIKEGTALDDHIAELQRMLTVFPESDRINHSITRMLIDKERYQDALPWAERFTRYQPENPNSYFLLGYIYQNTGECGKAIEHFNTAMRYSDETFRKVLHTHIGACYYDQEDFSAAYSHLKVGINPYTKATPDGDIYHLAFSAYIVGETEESILLLNMLLNTAPADKGEIALEAEKLMETLQQQEDDTPSFFSWLLQMGKQLFDKPQLSVNDRAQRDS
ncbi:MAG: CDC27 family protein [Gammaproteobacteria bacterium]|nr:CDC27 family protein [Gammaproteobacteria bacterium]